MGKIVAWKCEDTGTIFEDHTEYTKHRKRISKEKSKKRIEELEIANFELLLKTIASEVRTPDELASAIANNWSMFCRNYSRNTLYGFRKPNEKPVLKGLAINVSWSPFTKNFVGRLSMQLSSNIYGFGSTFFADTPIVLGSGGGNSHTHKWNWDVRLDPTIFTGMYKHHEKLETWKVLQGQEGNFI